MSGVPFVKYLSTYLVSNNSIINIAALLIYLFIAFTRENEHT